MSYFYACLAIVTGAILLVYSVGTVSDPYWSRSTRTMGIVGAAAGLGVLVTGLWAVTL